MGRSIVIGSTSPTRLERTAAASILGPGLWLVDPGHSRAWLAVLERRDRPKWWRLAGVSGYVLIPWRPGQQPGACLTIDRQPAHWWRTVTAVVPDDTSELVWRCIGGDLYPSEAGRLDGILRVGRRAEFQPMLFVPPQPRSRRPGSPAHCVGHMAFAGRDVGIAVDRGAAVGLTVSLRLLRAGRQVASR